MTELRIFRAVQYARIAHCRGKPLSLAIESASSLHGVPIEMVKHYVEWAETQCTGAQNNRLRPLGR